jgi:ribosomal protein L37AE/L43A
MNKCLFCKRPMVNKLEQHIKACHKCIVDLLMKKAQPQGKETSTCNFKH